MTTSEGQPKLHLEKSEAEKVDVTIPDNAASVDKTEVQFVENILPADERDYGDTAVRHASERSGISGMMKNNEAKPWYRRKTVIAAGAISAAGVAIVGQQFATAADQISQITSPSDNESRLTSVPIVGQDFFETNTIQIPVQTELTEEVPEADRYVYGGGVTPELAVMDPDVFTGTVDPSDQVAFNNEVIKKYEAEGIQLLNSMRQQYNLPPLSSIPEGSIDDTAQEILNRKSLIELIASKVASPSESGKLTSSLMVSGVPEYRSKIALITSGGAGDVYSAQPDSEKQVFYSASFNGNDINPRYASKALEFTSLTPNTDAQAHYHFYPSSADSSEGEWVQTDVWADTDSRWLDDLAAAPTR